MDYHADRFQDYSLMIYGQKNELLALLPANAVEKQVFSHQGLSYGGLILAKKLSYNEVTQVFKSVLKYYFEAGFKELIYKAIPSFYTHYPSFEEDIILFLLNSTVLKKQVGAVLNLQLPFSMQKRRLRCIRKAQKQNFEVVIQSDLSGFWQILENNLFERYQIKPVHSLDEITFLMRQFPDNIEQYDVLLDNELCAGTMIFKCQDIVHAQYIASNEVGREHNALDFLFDYLIREEYKECRYFSFGISNKNHLTNELNRGLLEWKESWGAKICPHITYSINTDAYSILDNYWED